MNYKPHYSVLHKECLEHMSGVKLALDCTLGAGGHTSLILNKFPDCTVHSIDQDIQAIENAQQFLEEFIKNKRLFLHHTNFAHFSEQSEYKFDAILMDIGVSSHQFDEASRGFSFRFDGPLDMRMNQNSSLKAEDIVNDFSEEELIKIIFDLGEDKFAKRIVSKIIEQRNIKRIETTKELENICFHAYPAKLRFDGIHPATKTFQALRIYVNDELGVLEKSIEKYSEMLNPNGKLLIISFHSLEDRIIKRKFRSLEESNPNYVILTKKPIVPSDEEININKRSRSAKLRVLQRIEDGHNQKNKYKKKYQSFSKINYREMP